MQGGRKNLQFKMLVVSLFLATVFSMSRVQASSGPAKKGKPASAAGGKAKKGADGKESVETELSVGFSPLICLPNYM